jgi:hypothetical protein
MHESRDREYWVAEEETRVPETDVGTRDPHGHHPEEMLISLSFS